VLRSGSGSPTAKKSFVALARVVYVSYGLGMGIVYIKVEDEQLARLDRWFSEPEREF